jgi:RNA polymerase sigma factor (sigma-70 family)
VSKRPEIALASPADGGAHDHPPGLDEVHGKRREYALRCLQGLGADLDLAEDLAQDLILRFLKRGYGDRDLEPGRERALLARMAYHAFVDHLRRNRLRRTGMLPEAGVASSPETDLEEGVERVRDLLSRIRLAGDARELLELRFGDGLTLVEIANRRACHVNTVRKQLDEVLGRLRRAAARSGEGLSA